MQPKDVEGMTNSVGSDQTAPTGIVCTVCLCYQSQNLEFLFTVRKQVLWYSSFEPQHDKTNKCLFTQRDSDQPGHPPSLIRVFAVRMKKAWALTCSYTLNAQQRLRSFCWFCHIAAHLYTHHDHVLDGWLILFYNFFF